MVETVNKEIEEIIHNGFDIEEFDKKALHFYCDDIPANAKNIILDGNGVEYEFRNEKEAVHEIYLLLVQNVIVDYDWSVYFN